MLLTGAMSKMGITDSCASCCRSFPNRCIAPYAAALARGRLDRAAAFAAWAQTDLKRTFAYSSINHLGYCVLGVCVAAKMTGRRPSLATEKAAALTGVLLQVFSHAPHRRRALLVHRPARAAQRRPSRPQRLRRPAQSGHPVFTRADGHRDLLLPRPARTNGFPGEFLILKAPSRSRPGPLRSSLLGLLMTAVFLLTVIQKVFSGPLNSRWAAMPDLTTANCSCCPALALMFLLGLYPQIIAGPIHAHGDAVGRAGELLMLAWTIYLSFLGALAALLVGNKRPQAVSVIALLTALTGLAISISAVVQCQPEKSSPSHASRGSRSSASNTTSPPTASASSSSCSPESPPPPAFSSPGTSSHRTGEFFAFYLVLIGGVYGVFLSFDLFLLFVFYEIAIIPKYFLIAIWGSVPRTIPSGSHPGSLREYAAMKLALYSFAGSALVLAGMVAAWSVSGGHSLSFEVLAKYPFPAHFQMGAFPLVFVGFAVLAGMWPFHTWAPTGHAAAPTAASMLLAGRGHEARRLRLPARRHDALPPRPRSLGLPRTGPWLVARGLRAARPHRHSLRRQRRVSSSAI